MAVAGLIKPRKKVTFGAPVLPKLKAPTAAPSAQKGPSAPVAPAPFTPAAAPAPRVTPPPAPTLSSESDRIGAREGYGATVADVNSQLRSLAANYGFAPDVTQFGWGGPDNPTVDSQLTAGVTANSPGSTADILLRNLQGQQQNIDETNEASNTFFSGRRLNDRGKADTDYGAQVAKAQRDYQDAVQSLTTSILQARSGRNQTFRNADISDIQNAQAAPPEAQAGSVIPPRPALAPGVSLPVGSKQVFDPTLQKWVVKDKTGRVVWG